MTTDRGGAAFALSNARAARWQRASTVARSHVIDHAGLHERAAGLDLRGPDVDGPGTAVVDGGVGVLVARAADRHPARRAVGALPPPRPTREGTRTGVRAAVQPAHARGWRRLCPAASPAGAAPGPPPGPGDSARYRVEPSPHHGRLRHGEVGPDPAAARAARGPWGHRHRVRPGPGVHTAVLHARTRRRDSQSPRCPLAVLESR